MLWKLTKVSVLTFIAVFVAVMVFVDLPDGKVDIKTGKFVESEKITTVIKTVVKADNSYLSSDKYAICYHNVTEAHKANGLHDRNRSKSIEIKEQLCKIAATSTTGEGSAWLK